jgi:hypothetical protein
MVASVVAKAITSLLRILAGVIVCWAVGALLAGIAKFVPLAEPQVGKLGRDFVVLTITLYLIPLLVAGYVTVRYFAPGSLWHAAAVGFLAALSSKALITYWDSMTIIVAATFAAIVCMAGGGISLARSRKEKAPNNPLDRHGP